MGTFKRKKSSKDTAKGNTNNRGYSGLSIMTRYYFSMHNNQSNDKMPAGLRLSLIESENDRENLSINSMMAACNNQEFNYPERCLTTCKINCESLQCNSSKKNPVDYHFENLHKVQASNILLQQASHEVVYLQQLKSREKLI